MGRQSREKRERAVARERGAAMGAARGCLFCRSKGESFKSEEHVFPESLGNVETVLPLGVVCDRCNNGPLAEVDKHICEFFPIMMRRMFLGIENKRGKIPVTRCFNGQVRNTGPAAIEIVNGHGKPIMNETGRSDEGIHLQMQTGGGRKMTPRYASELSRGVLKAALECAWLDHGTKVLEPRFDHVRHVVLGAPHDGFFVMLNQADPDGTGLRLDYYLIEDGDETRMCVAACYFGVFVATDSHAAGPAEAYPEDVASVITFAATDL